jgi:hypothetical protein
MYAIKVEVSDPNASSWSFKAQKTMYGGKRIAKGNVIFVFASENEGGPGLIARGVVSIAEAIPRKQGIELRRHASASRSPAHVKQIAAWVGANSSLSVNGTTDALRPNSIQVLSSSHEQDRWPLRGGCYIPTRLLLTGPSLLCTSVPERRLTLPSRGQPPGYALQPPLMSNVRALSLIRSLSSGHGLPRPNAIQSLPMKPTQRSCHTQEQLTGPGTVGALSAPSKYPGIALR